MKPPNSDALLDERLKNYTSSANCSLNSKKSLINRSLDSRLAIYLGVEKHQNPLEGQPNVRSDDG